MPRGVLGAVSCTALLVGGCLHAPVLWSPDGRWVAYTIAVRGEAALPAPGWLFDTSARMRTDLPASDEERRRPPRAYRIWATRIDTGVSVLLEESRGPLTSPCWAPDGKALAFARLVPEAEGRARLEIVVQDSPDQQRVLLSRPHAELHERSTDLPGLSLAWSPDGRYLAVPLFQQTLDLAILRADNGRVLKVVDDAFLPAWSPDGTKLAFLRGGGESESLHYLDNHFGPTRQLAEIGQTSQPPAWSRDSQAVVMIRHPARRGGEAPTPQAELIRIKVATGTVESIVRIPTDPADRDKTFLGASFSIDRDGETLYFARDVQGEPTEIATFRPRNKETARKFHPIDPAIRIGALAASPTEERLALRVGSPGYLSPPGLVDTSADRPTITPIIPDDSARVEWVTTFLDAAIGLLRAGLPPVTARGHNVERATLLPIPGELEIPARQEVAIRLRRLGRLGRPLCDRPADAPPAEPGLAAFLDEARLFFDYLRQDYAAALASLETLETRPTHADQRLRLLSVRAQIALGRGDYAQALQTIAFLQSIRRTASRRIEATPSGPVLTPLSDPNQGWPDYLARKAEELRRQASGGSRSGAEPLNLFGQDNLEGLAPLPIEGAPVAAPFAPRAQ